MLDVLDDALLKTECYICMEVCSTKSPCECASYVHQDCLIQFLKTSGNMNCTICKGQYPIPQQKKLWGWAIFWIGLFFPSGWLGSCILGDCQDYIPFSVNSLFSAIVCDLVLLLIWVCFKLIPRRR